MTLALWLVLAQWEPIAFKEAGEVRITPEEMRLQPGRPMTGIRWKGEVPRDGYELRWEGLRKRGNDFFAMATFPVGQTHCSFITGGWGGDIIGLSTLDGQTAADNETRAYFNFENDRWYAFRIRVTAERIEVWIDGERVTRVARSEFEIGLRPGDTTRMTPLGFASYATEGWIRNVSWRKL